MLGPIFELPGIPQIVLHPAFSVFRQCYPWGWLRSYMHGAKIPTSLLQKLQLDSQLIIGASSPVIFSAHLCSTRV